MLGGGNPPHVTSPTWDPTPSHTQALSNQYLDFAFQSYWDSGFIELHYSTSKILPDSEIRIPLHGAILN